MKPKTTLSNYLTAYISSEMLTFNVNQVENNSNSSTIHLLKISRSKSLHNELKHVDINIIDNQLDSIKLYNMHNQALTIFNMTQLGDWIRLMQVIHDGIQSYNSLNN